MSTLTAGVELELLKLTHRRDHILSWAWALSHDRTLRDNVVWPEEEMAAELREIDAKIDRIKSLEGART